MPNDFGVFTSDVYLSTGADRVFMSRISSTSQSYGFWDSNDILLIPFPELYSVLKVLLM
jgi:hypothetical protein